MESEWIMNNYNRILMILLTVTVCMLGTGVGTANDVNLMLAGHFDGYTHDVAVSGNYAYIGQEQDFVVLDISNPASPVELGRCITSGHISDVAVSGDHAYVTGYSKGLEIIDVSNRSTPMLAGSFNIIGGANAIAVSGNYAYIVNNFNGFVIVDISNKSSPTFAGRYNITGSADDVAVSGDHAYVASWDNGLVIIDASNKSSPTLAGSYNMPGGAGNVAVSGDHAYMSNYFSGLIIVDISNKSAPILANSFSTAGNTVDVAVSGDYAYVIDYSYGLILVDTSNKSESTLAGNYNTSGNACGVAVTGDYVYVAVEANGLVILKAYTSGTDTTPPVVTITSPTNGSNVTTSILTVTGTASDDIDIASVMVNGFLATGSTNWSAGITLAWGVNNITVIATDTSGNTVIKIITINYIHSAGTLPGNMDELVSITGQQTTPIVWNASNFGGFKYNSSDILSTETLTIAPFTLNGPDIDRIIEAGGLSYATSFVWHEYPIHKDLGLYVNNYDEGYSTGYLNGKQYVAINGVPDKLAIPLIEFDSNDVKTLRTGEVWDIGGGFSITAMQIDEDSDKVWIQLDKNGVYCDDQVLDTGSNSLQNRVWTYNEDVAGEYDVPILSLYVSGIMLGTDAEYVQIKYLSLIDNNVSQISPENNFGNMEVTSIMGNSLGFSNWIDLDLTPGNSPSMIMENMSFITLDNPNSIEFYPFMVRDEMPTLYDTGGFISGNYSSLWNLSEGYTIALQEVGRKGDKAMFSLLHDGVIIDQKIMTERLIASNDPDSNYQYIKNGTLIINATLDFVFRGQDSEIATLTNVYQYSGVDGSVLLSNESHFFKSISLTGILWNLSEGYTLTMKDISLTGDKAWFELSKNNLVLKDAILTEDYMDAFIFTSGGVNIRFIVDTIFSGTNENMVKISNVDQYSNVSGYLISDATHFYKSGDPAGIPWSLPNGYSLSMKDIEYPKDEKVWFELSRNGNILKEDIIKSGDMFFYDNGSESFNCTVVGVMRGTMGDVVKVANINLYSGMDGELVQNESKTYATEYPDGEIWQLPEGYSLNPRDVSQNGDKVWLSLSKNDMVMKDEIIDINVNDADRWFSYYNSTGALVFSTHVDEIYSSQICGLVILTDTTQYSEINGTSLLQVPRKTLKSGTSLGDTTPPAITITSPADGSNASTSGITVTGTASDASGIATVTVNGVLATGTTRWSSDVTLIAGENNITVVAIDDAGNQNTNTITVYLVSYPTGSISIGSAIVSLNSTVTIPVNVANVMDISGIYFDLIYDSSVVAVSSVSANENFAGSSITSNIDNANGTIRVVLANSNFIQASAETPVIDITFDTIGGPGSSTSLDLQNVEFSDSGFNPYTPAVVADGMVTVGIKGDFNGNDRVDIGDVAKVAFMVAGNVPEDLNADFNGNGRVDVGDAAKIASYLAGKVSEI